ncbi:MAG: hypothetical protein JNK74_08760 [Candidatus Hydrogenedentes bacterium]|nr:hypothetical protein [Candidatus Hydrogenedentota bacterium]
MIDLPYWYGADLDVPDAEELGEEQLLEGPKPYSSARSRHNPPTTGRRPKVDCKFAGGELTLQVDTGHASIQSGAERVCDVFGLLSKVEFP